ncbi:MAG: hypothetical protein KAW88_08220, partial [Candidatus Cloacimonetes bacterium]|nr:hypothetical protein [Candidatus Cloacimonadota bacterium]
TIYPSQELQLDNQPQIGEFIIDKRYYSFGEVFPSRIIEIGEPAIMRDLRVVTVTVNPFQYDPASEELRIIKNIDFVVNTNGIGGNNVKVHERKISRFFEPLYKATILNYDEIISNRDDGYQEQCYLFIYPNDATIENYLEDLTEWKHQKGFEVVAVSTSETGTTNTSIKNYIQNAYNTWENPPEFICLVGDASGAFTIPTWFESWSWYNGEGDHPYTQLEGNDILADAFIGRLSFNTHNEFQTIIAKILNYEKVPYMGQTDWYESVLLVGDTSPTGQSVVITNKYIKELMLAVNNDYTFTELYGTQPSVTSMVNAVNNGVSFFNYRGWVGMSDWSNSTTNSLNNGFMLPVVVTLTCGTGDFYNTTGRTEVFLNAGSPSVPKGGIAAIGTATMGTHTRYNNPISSGIYFGIFVEQTYNMGGALARGKLNLYNCFPDNPGNCIEIYSYWNNLMGDPGMEVWTGIPQEMVVTYETQVSLGTNYLQVTVEDTNNNPLENAWVTALMEDDDIFATGYTDTEGNIILPISAEIEGTAHLTVTRHNYIPHLGSFDVGISDRFVNVFEIAIDDDNLGTSSGNGDG